jgi:GDP-L-fucose synthase
MGRATSSTSGARTCCPPSSAGSPEVVLWGTGTPRREFLHVDDLAEACIHLLRTYDAPEPINVGVGDDLTIAELAGLVAAVVGFDGRTAWDATKPDGAPRKLLDVGPIRALGWRARIPLREGVEATVAWYREHVAASSAPQA